MIQNEWLAPAKDGKVRPERYVRILNGRKGRVDILVEELGDFVSIVEIKATDWDRIKPENLRRNIRRQIRQVWSYIESQLEKIDGDNINVCPGIIFPKLPKSKETLKLIESGFNTQGIAVVWHEESIADL